MSPSVNIYEANDIIKNKFKKLLIENERNLLKGTIAEKSLPYFFIRKPDLYLQLEELISTKIKNDFISSHQLIIFYNNVIILLNNLVDMQIIRTTDNIFKQIQQKNNELLMNSLKQVKDEKMEVDNDYSKEFNKKLFNQYQYYCINMIKIYEDQIMKLCGIDIENIKYIQKENIIDNNLVINSNCYYVELLYISLYVNTKEILKIIEMDDIELFNIDKFLIDEYEYINFFLEINK